MALSYALRLVCVVAVSFGLLQVAFELLLWAAAPVVLRLLPSLSLRFRERTLYLVQLTPAMLALLGTAFCAAPQYIANETNLAPERVGWLCLVLAATIALWLAVRIALGIRMAVRTTQFSRDCRRIADGTYPAESRIPIVAVSLATPRVALVGLLNPFILISKSLLGAGGLNPLALEIVLDHERSHAAQHDNWKLLSLHCLPRLNLKLPNGKTWMQLWRNAAERAADDDAVGGNSGRGFLLAETLVALARSHAVASPRIACTNFLCDETELALRVESLIQANPEQTLPRSYKLGIAVCFLLAGGAVLLANLASALREVPEHILHLG
jgi:beta-lactamase regulating signal transducer with metallopeptidase domain